MTTTPKNGNKIEDERAKALLLFTEDIAPGLKIEMPLKKILASTSSEFQKVDVIETYFGKTLVTDGKTQSSQFDEFAYHESLVHPCLLRAASLGGSTESSASAAAAASAPTGPKTVFIGGGGELATAREVLRHKSVERLVMVDLDSKVIEVSKKFLPEWGGEAVATDPRLELIVGDAYEYLLNTPEKFDAIIMDISDPIEAGPGIMLYTKEFYEHAVTRLNDGGVFVTQGGTAEAIPVAAVDFVQADDPSCFAPIRNTLASVFDCVVPYTTNIPSFGGDWGFIMAFQCPNTDDAATIQEKWQIPPRDFIDDLIERLITGGSGSLGYYDGITHMRMFALTKPLRKYVAKDYRIMTRDNPIFMY